MLNWLALWLALVSIHAPAWGATMGLFYSGGDYWFQSTRPRGARRKQMGLTVDDVKFQSTRPRGARHRAAGLEVLLGGFNPRARVGRDSFGSMVSKGDV